MKRISAKSVLKQAQRVVGNYCGVYFEGKINESTRATPDGANMIVGVTVSPPITIFGQLRSRLEIETNSDSRVFLA